MMAEDRRFLGQTKDMAGSMGFMPVSVSLGPQVPWQQCRGDGLRWRKCAQWVCASEQRDLEISKPQLCLRANLLNQTLLQRGMNLHYPEQ